MDATNGKSVALNKKANRNTFKEEKPGETSQKAKWKIDVGLN